MWSWCIPYLLATPHLKTLISFGQVNLLQAHCLKEYRLGIVFFPSSKQDKLEEKKKFKY